MSSSDPSRIAQRFETIELKIAELERSVQELSDVLYRQQRELEATQERHSQLLRQLDARQAEQESDGEDAATRVEIPPHY